MKLTQFQLIREIGEIEQITLQGSLGTDMVVFLHIRGKKIEILRGEISSVPHRIFRDGIAEKLEQQLQ